MDRKILTRESLVALQFFNRKFALLSLPVVMLLLPLISRAQSIQNYAGEFLQLGVGARSLAMGGAAISTANDATAGYWNPAALNLLSYPSVSGMHEARFDNTVKYDYGALAIPLSASSSASVSVLHIGVSDIKDTRSALVDRNNNGVFDDDDYIDYTKVRSFGNHDWGVLLSYAKAIDTNFSYGVNAKFISRQLDPQNSATGLGADVGARYQVNPSVAVAAVIQDVTTTLLSYTTGTKELISPTLKLGGSYLLDITDNGYHRVLLSSDADVRFENRGSVSEVHAGPLSADLHFGAEYQLGNLLAIRGGYNDLKMFSVGAGIKLGKLNIDYSFLSFNGEDELGNTHRISFSFTFEQPKWKRSVQ